MPTQPRVPRSHERFGGRYRTHTAPPEVQALGRALNRILSDDRDPDLSALPPELAQAVRRLREVI